jgi:transcriptional regulator with XRE-family HTH domain
MSIDVGERLRNVRKAKGVSQRELAKRVGVTNSTISLIEQNRVSPSVASLKKVLDGIPMTLSDFFTMDVEPNEDHYFYLREQQPDIGQGNLNYFLIGADHQNRNITLLREVYEPGSDTGEDMISHEGEECGIVIEGEVEVTVGDIVKILSEGEGYYFSTNKPHRFRNLTDNQATIISASTPVTF